jgi:hypothetical protein
MPDVQFIGAAPAASIPHLRALGIDACRGELVALTEDHCVPGSSWVDTLLQHADETIDVIGGAMDNARRRRALDWGAYFAEYGFYAGTRRVRRADESPLLTAANVAYRRRVVADVAAWARQGEWENESHERLGAAGRVFRFDPSLVVAQNETYQFMPFCAQRFKHGFEFARHRLERERNRRWVLLFASPVLPFLLTARVGAEAGATRWGAYIRALPFTFAFLAAWSLGEAAAYLRGGVSLRRASNTV